ncbi:hypothetical protein [Methylobacterium sp. CCH5-D2]|uniref:hypothetical protein n=1 Tax=Methylobacterium sp. CCH5-D2 TaxID=1768765 RepID=UPI00082CF23B|nr:hypothetical protein [Methylobacterium sp. CCH5-D2]
MKAGEGTSGTLAAGEDLLAAAIHAVTAAEQRRDQQLLFMASLAQESAALQTAKDVLAQIERTLELAQMHWTLIVSLVSETDGSVGGAAPVVRNGGLAGELSHQIAEAELRSSILAEAVTDVVRTGADASETLEQLYEQMDLLERLRRQQVVARTSARIKPMTG